MDDFVGAADGGDDGGGFRGGEEAVGGFGDYVSDGFEVAVFDGLTDFGGADSAGSVGFAGDDDAFYAAGFEFLLHDAVVNAGYLAERFFPDVAAVYAQGFGNFLEYVNVKLGMGFNDKVFVLQEVGGEGGIGDYVAAGSVVEDVF